MTSTRHPPRAADPAAAGRPPGPARPARPASTYRRRGRDRAGLAGRARRSPSALSSAVRRRVQRRLLRARLGLQQPPRSCSRQRFPAPVRRHRRRRRAGRRPVTDPAVQRRRRRRCSPSSRRCRTCAAVEDPYATPGAISADGRTAGRARSASTWSTRSTCRSRTASGCSTSPRTPTRRRARGRARRPDRRSRPSRARSAPRASASPPPRVILLLTFGSVVAAGLPILVAVAGLAVSSTLTGRADRVHRRARLVDLARHHDGHRHRHRLRAADGHPVPRVAGRRARPARRRPSPPWTPPAAAVHGRRQHRRDQHARPVRDGPVVHARRRPGHDPRRARRDGSPASRCSRRCWATSAGTSTGCGCRSAGAGAGRGRGRRARRAERAAGCGGAGWSSGTACVAAVAGVAVLLALAAPFLGVRFGFPDAGNNREGTSDPAGVRHARPTASAPAPTGRCCWSPSCPTGGDGARSSRSPARCGRPPASPRSRRPRLNQAGDTAVLTVVPDHRPAGRRAPRTWSTGCATRPPGGDRRAPARRARRRRDRDLDRQHRQHRQAASRCSSAAWCCCRCCCCSCRSAASRSRSRPPR